MSEGKWDPYWEGGCFLPTPLPLPPASGIEFEKNAEEVLIQTDEIVKLAQPGDYFEIMKNVGGGGGQTDEAAGDQAGGWDRRNNDRIKTPRPQGHAGEARAPAL